MNHAPLRKPAEAAASGAAWEPPPAGWLDINLSPLYSRLERTAAAGAEPVVRAYLTPVLKRLGSSLMVTSYILMDVKLFAARVVTQCGAKAAEVLPELMEWDALAGEASRADIVIEQAVSLLSIALAYRDARSASLDPVSQAILNACDYIRQNFHRKELTLRDTARHVNLSNNHFCTLFKKEMGMSFLDYLTKLRMEKAADYLLTSQMGSSDIAELVGYTDPNYFRVLFKRHTGKSPRDYRALRR